MPASASARERRIWASLGRLSGVLNALIDAGLIAVMAGQDTAGRLRPTYAPTPQGRATRAHLTPTILAANRAKFAPLMAKIAVLSSPETPLG